MVDQARADVHRLVDTSVARPSGLRQRLRRWRTGEVELEAAELLTESEDLGATAIRQCSLGERVTVAGTLRTVTLRTHGGVQALEAELYDGSATVQLIWLGRRRIAGISPGRSVVVHGRVTDQRGGPTIFNPSYELRA
jgi:RecG-like helicase